MNSNFITYSNFPLWYVCKVDSLQEKFRGYTLLSFNSHSNIWMGFSRKQDDFGDEGKIQSSPKNLAKKFYAGQEREYNGAFNYTPPVDILLIPDFPIEGKKTILNIEPLSNRERKEFESALEKLSLPKE